MLTFRKILLQDKLFIILFIFVIIISIIRISIPKQSNYGPNSTKIIGIIIECHHINDQYKMTIKGKEKVIVYDYLDNMKILEKMYSKRIKGYKIAGYEIIE